MSVNKAAHVLRLYYLKRRSRWDSGIGTEMPEAYKKFWREWKIQKPAAVHYVPKEGLFERKEETGQVFPVQNIPIPVKYPKEHNEGIWGGEGVVQGFQKRTPTKRRVPHFWVPILKKSVVYSEILNKYMSVVVTQRTIDLIHENCGFDHYLLKTQACDLKSELALHLKRELLLALSKKTLYPDDENKRDEVYAKYQQYLSAYTPEEIEWYGLTWKSACKKLISQKSSVAVTVPLKHQYRAELIAKLSTPNTEESETPSSKISSKMEWLSKLNPLSKSPGTS